MDIEASVHFSHDSNHRTLIEVVFTDRDGSDSVLLTVAEAIDLMEQVNGAIPVDAPEREQENPTRNPSQSH